MTAIVFYEKPGCVTNARQRRLLEAAGHQVVRRNLLVERWTAERLRDTATVAMCLLLEDPLQASIDLQPPFQIQDLQDCSRL